MPVLAAEIWCLGLMTSRTEHKGLASTSAERNPLKSMGVWEEGRSLFSESPTQVACLVLLSFFISCSRDSATSRYHATQVFLVNVKFVFWLACGVSARIEMKSVVLVSVCSGRWRWYNKVPLVNEGVDSAVALLWHQSHKNIWESSTCN